VSAWVALAGCSNQGRVAKTTARPPATQVAAVTETIRGVATVDNYRWLEADGAEVAAWTDAQNAYTRQVLDRLPGRQVLTDRLRTLMNIGSVTPPIVRSGRHFYSRASLAESQPIVYWRDGDRGEEKKLIDPATLDPSRPTALAWFAPSADGKLLAYGTYHTGDVQPALHLLDVHAAKPVPLEIPNVRKPCSGCPTDRASSIRAKTPAAGTACSIA
jgi:prolyl oligopeptidase